MKRIKLVAAVAVVAAVPFAVVEAAADAHHASPYTSPYTGWGHPANTVAVSGTVADSSGAPFDGVTVTATLKSSGVAWGFGKTKHAARHGVKAKHVKKTKPFTSAPVSTVTAGGGLYSLDVQKNGTYSFTFTPPTASGYAPVKETVKVGNADKTLPTVTLLKAAPTATAAPAITPNTGVASGSTLTATSGTWSASGLTYGYQWLRNGQKISGATSSTYTVTAADAGSKVSVLVTATSTGALPGYSASQPVTVAKLASTTTATATTVGTKHPVTALQVTIAAPGVAKPTGTIVVKDADGKVVGKGVLFPWNKGVVTVPLAKLAPGTYSLTVTYSGNAAVSGSTSAAVSVTVPAPTTTPTTTTPTPEPGHWKHGHKK